MTRRQLSDRARRLRGLALIAALSISASAFGSEPEGVRAAIHQKLSAALALMDENRHEAVFELLIAPSQLAGLKARGKYARALEQFPIEKQASMKQLMRGLLRSGVTLRVSEDGTRADFLLPESATRYATFVHEGGNWYLANR